MERELYRRSPMNNYSPLSPPGSVADSVAALRWFREIIFVTLIVEALFALPIPHHFSLMELPGR